ncbi:MAG TPA: hypothetical protein DDW65_02090 [Firmicutes bacterium]|nr:hypothetical protein [Bacillota bacterium]
MEFLYSDEGQLLWLKGYGHPARYQDLVKRKVIPSEIAAKMPSAKAYEKAVFPSLEQQETAKKIIAADWDKVVRVNVTNK